MRWLKYQLWFMVVVLYCGPAAMMQDPEDAIIRSTRNLRNRIRAEEAAHRWLMRQQS